MKIESSQTPLFGKIASVGQDHVKKADQEKKSDSQERLQSAAFVELKKANHQIAQLQSLGVSLANIQKELGELIDFNSKIPYDLEQEVLQKIKNLQNKLDPLLRDAKRHQGLTLPEKITLNDLAQSSKDLKKLSKSIQREIKKLEEGIEKFFSSSKEVDLEEAKLKDSRFKIAHNTRNLSSSFRDLIA